MVVAVSAMRMMQTPVYEIVDVIAMRHGFVAAIRPVPVLRLVAGGVMVRIAAARIPCTHADDMLIGTAPLGVFEPAMIEIIDMAFVLHGDVPAAWAMDVRRNLVGTALFGGHGGSFLPPLNHRQEICQRSGCGKGHTSGRRHVRFGVEKQTWRSAITRSALHPILLQNSAAHEGWGEL